MTLRIRRGTEADRTTVTPAEGELVYTTDKKRLFVGDGVTAGGVAVLSPTSTIATETPQFERTQSSTSHVVNTALSLIKRNTNQSSLAYDMGGPAINFQVNYGDGSIGPQTIALIGSRFQAGSSAYNHDFQFSVLNGNTGSTYDTLLTLSRLKADFDVPVKPRTFSDSTERTTHYATFTEPDASPAAGDITFVNDAGNGKARLEVYTDGAWNSLLTRRFAHTDPLYSPTFVREASGSSAAGINGVQTNVMRFIKRKTDDTAPNINISGPSVRFEYAYGAYDPNAGTTYINAGSFVTGQSYRISTVGTTNFTLIGAADNTVGTQFIATGAGTGTGQATKETEIQFAYIGSAYYGSSGDHEMNFYTTSDLGQTFQSSLVLSRKKATFYVPAKLAVYATTTARDAAITAPEAGMMIYLTATNKAQVYNGTTWADLN